MDEMKPQAPMAPEFDGHPTQAHADHAVIMKAHSIISDPTRMDAVHQLHGHSGGLIAYLKKKKMALESKEKMAGAEPKSETPAMEAAEGKSG